MNIAVCYLTQETKNLSFNYEHLLNQIKTSKLHNIDLYRYESSEIIEHQVIDNNIVKFNYKYLRDKFNYWKFIVNVVDSGMISKTSKTPIGGLTIFPLLDLYETHPNYDMYMFIENDVLIYSPKNIFDSIDENADITFINKRVLNDSWVWGKPGFSNLEYKSWSGLLVLYFIKPHIIKKFIDEIIRKGFFGHDEYLLNGMTLSDNNIIKAYLSDKFDAQVCLLPKHVKCDKPYELVHPIKTQEEYNKITYII